MSNKSGTSPQVISLPSGGGALKGIGDTFTPDLFTGTGTYTVPLDVPAGRNGFQPQLSLSYSSGTGNGPFGLGWSLSVPNVGRKTSDGVPRYGNDDTFVLSGTEDLVAVGQPEPGVTRYRPRTEGSFARIDRRTEGWEVRTGDGLVHRYEDRLADPAQPARVFRWNLSETTDPFGNGIEYDYLADRGNLYLQRIRYIDHDSGDGREDAPRFLVSVTFVYEARPDPFSDHRAGFGIRTGLRCRRIEIRSQDQLARTYELDYVDDLVEDSDRPPADLPRNGMSLLGRVRIVGHGPGGATQELPPLDLGYTRFAPERRRFQPLQASGGGLPPVSLGDDDFETVDLFGNGLPDIVQMNGSVRFWRNRGGGRFDAPQEMGEVPAGVRLRDPGVQFADMNGDGRADLLVLAQRGYFPLSFAGRWSPQGFVQYATAPSVEFGDTELRLVDLDGDGVIDALRTSDRFELFFNDARDGWTHVETRQRGPIAEFPDVRFSDPRVKLADVNGDGLQDIVLVDQGRVDYWPYLGHGRWGRRVTMAASPVFQDEPPLPTGFDPARVLLGDVDGDGLDDIVYVQANRVTFWINQGGERWSDPVTVQGTPRFTDIDGVRLTDVLGTGMAGVLWTADAGSGAGSHYQFLDLTGGLKPYLLERMDNNMGAVTTVGYVSSTSHYLADDVRPATRWTTPLPFPVHVVDRVETVDEVSAGKLTRQFRYHHGYWDGVEQELRGFGLVDQLDTESFDDFHAERPGGGFAAVAERQFSPPTLTRTWFHPGAVGEEFEAWREPDRSTGTWPDDPAALGHTAAINAFLATLPQQRAKRDALRALAGQVLRTELYARDGTALEARPYTVTERAYGLREESPPAAGDAARRRVFFPHLVAERVSQWERGSEPQTSLTFRDDYDPFGQPRRVTSLAVPRGRNFRVAADQAEPYLGTTTTTSYAQRDERHHYIVDRVARTTTHEVLNDGRPPAFALHEAIRAGTARLNLIGQSLTYFDGPAFEGLPAGQLGSFGAPVREERLVLTEELVRQAHQGGDLPPYLTPTGPPAWTADYPQAFRDATPADAGHTFSAGGGGRARGWFVQTERHRYDFQVDDMAPSRGLVVADRDPLGREITIEHDPFALLPVRVTNPAGLVTTATYDYRVLQPRQVVDANGNRAAFGYTPLGYLERSAVMGREGEAVGDTLDVPGTRFVYALERSPGQPVSIRSIERVHHVTATDVPDGQRNQTIETVEFSDGFGRLVQTRTRAEDVIFGDAVSGGGTLPSDQADPTTADPITGRRGSSSEPNVLVSGWQIYDNKGRVVEAYEPFFATGWTFSPSDDAQRGEPTSSFYDPRGLLVRTVRPDGAEELVLYGIPADLAEPAKVEPTPWEVFTYDANDNAGRTHRASAGGYEHHWNTPTSVVVDALGRTVLTVTRLRAPRKGPNAPLPPIDEVRTRSRYDIRGNLVAVTDPLRRPALRYVHDLFDRVLRTESIDAGIGRTVLDADGREIERRDGKGALILQSHDILGRPSRLWARDATGGPVTLRERLAYGDGGRPDQPAAERTANRSANRLGALHRHHDEAGVLTLEQYDVKGNVLEKTRRVISDPVVAAAFPDGFRVDWEPRPGSSLGELEAQLLDPQVFASSSRFDALSRVRTMRFPQATDGRRREVQATYNRAGALERVALDGDAVVERIGYDARGQRTLVALGNGVMTRYAHDPRSFRLLRQRAERYTKPSPDALTYRPTGAPLQDTAYRYDEVGNILETVERSPGSGIRGNGAAGSSADAALRAAVAQGDALARLFTYDPLYRLSSATGRECVADRPSDPWGDSPRCSAPGQANVADLTTALRESYQYDAAGNLLRLGHETAEAPFVRLYALGAGTNRLTQMTVGTTRFTYSYDGSGNLVSETASRHLAWDHSDRMTGFRVQAGAAEPSVQVAYLYDAAGERTRKVVRKQGGQISSTTYIDGSFEHHRWPQGANDVVHVLDGEERIALVRSGPAHPDDRGPATQYHLRDHLVSSNVVTDQAGGFVNREEYAPFGETSLGSFGRKRYRYTAKERDEESGLSYHGARYYAPWLARWTAPDPIGGSDDLNLYAYVGNAPLVFNDPDGTQGEPTTVPAPASNETITVEGDSVIHTTKVGGLKISKCLDYDPRPAITAPGLRSSEPPMTVGPVSREKAADIVIRPDLQPDYKQTDPYQRESDRRYYNKQERKIREQQHAALRREEDAVETSMRRPVFTSEGGLSLAAAPLALLGFTIIYLRVRVQTGGLYVGRTGANEENFVATATSRFRRHNRRGARAGHQFEWRVLDIVSTDLGPIVEQENVNRFGGTKLDGGRLENTYNPMTRKNYEEAARRFGRPIVPSPVQRGGGSRAPRIPATGPARSRARLPRRK